MKSSKEFFIGTVPMIIFEGSGLVYIQNKGAENRPSVFIGAKNVDTTNGIEIRSGGTFVHEFNKQVIIYACSHTPMIEVAVMHAYDAVEEVWK